MRAFSDEGIDIELLVLANIRNVLSNDVIIRFVLRNLIDNGLPPIGWTENGVT